RGFQLFRWASRRSMKALDLRCESVENQMVIVSSKSLDRTLCSNWPVRVEWRRGGPELREWAYPIGARDQNLFVLEPSRQDELSRIDDALQALREGRIVIVVDDEDRENEGDFIAAAEKVSPETIEFMITHGRGLLCMPILPETAARLQLGPMVERNTAPHQTPYTVPVDHVSCRTGISAQERAQTVRAIIDPSTHPDDLVRPGHLFPLVAKEGGVLRRAGHTEATVDLARLAGLAPAGVLCEVLDGTGVASRERLHQIAREHNLSIVSIES